MEKTKYPRAEILKNFYDLLKNVCQKRFINTRPENNSEQLSDYILIRMANGIQDHGATYQTANLQIVVFVRDKTKGIEDTLTLQNKIDAITDLFPIITKRFSAIDANLIASGADNTGFHYAIIQTRLTIKK